MRKFLIGLFIGLALTSTSVYGATVLFPYQGGTGTGVVPTNGQILVGQSNGTYLPQATSTLGISGNPFNQWLDTTSSPTFAGLTVTDINFTNATGTYLYVTNPPTISPTRVYDDNHQLVDKEYVDTAVTALGSRYYMYDTASGISDYKLISLTPSADAETSDAHAEVINDEYLRGWISPTAGVPTELITGLYSFPVYVQQSGGTGKKDLRLYWTLVERKADNSEVVIGTSSNSNLISETKSKYNIFLTLTSDYSIASDSYLLFKIYADVSGSGGDPSVTLFYEGASDSHWEIPTNLEILSDQFVPYTGANANVDLGAYNLSSTGILSGGWNSRLGGISTDGLSNYTYLAVEETKLAGALSLPMITAHSPSLALNGLPINLFTFDEGVFIGEGDSAGEVATDFKWGFPKIGFVSSDASESAYIYMSTSTGVLNFVLADGYLFDNAVGLDGSLFVADDSTASDSNGILYLGREDTGWESLTFSNALGRFSFSNDLYITGNASTTGNLIVGDNSTTTNSGYFGSSLGLNSEYINSWSDLSTYVGGANPFNQWLDTTSSVAFATTTFFGDLEIRHNDDGTYISGDGGVIIEDALGITSSGFDGSNLNEPMMLFNNSDDTDSSSGIIIYNPTQNILSFGALDDSFSFYSSTTNYLFGDTFKLGNNINLTDNGALENEYSFIAGNNINGVFNDGINLTTNIAIGNNVTSTDSGIQVGENIEGNGYSFGFNIDNSASLLLGGELNGNGSVMTGFYIEGTQRATAMGRFITANGESPVAMGTNLSANGDYSIAIGHNATSSGDYSITIGVDSEASGDYSSIIGGNMNTLSGNYSSISGGTLNNNAGLFSFIAGGAGNTASGNYTSILSSISSTASGLTSSLYNSRYSTSSGDGAVIISGNTVEANGYGATIIASEYGTSQGYGTVMVNSIYSDVSGYGSSVYNATAVNNSGIQSMVVDSTYVDDTGDSWFNFTAGVTSSTIDINEGIVASRTTWATSTSYTAGDYIQSTDNAFSLPLTYVALQNNVADADNKPTSGVNYASYWYPIVSTKNMRLGGDDQKIQGSYNSIYNGIGSYITGNFNQLFGGSASVTGSNNFVVNLDYTSPISVVDSNVFTVIGGNVGIGTTTPDTALSVVGDTTLEKVIVSGTATSTFAGNLDVAGNIEGSNVYTGDLWFANGWKITEAEKLGRDYSGLVIFNGEGKEIAEITEAGFVNTDLLKRIEALEDKQNWLTRIINKIKLWIKN